ncbi:type II secretion system major pseudopilin GspG [Gemmatimonas sp.]
MRLTPLPPRRRLAPVRARRAFTLIEILVVIAVIAILASLVAPNVFQHVGTARTTTARSQLEMLATALDAYRLDTGRYPSTEQGLAALVEAPTVDGTANWRGPYLRRAVPLDPWGTPYVYRSPGEKNAGGFDLLSYGADGRAGGDGDNADILGWQ